MHRKGTSPRRALLVFLRHPGKDIVILVEVVADQPGAVISIGVDVIVDIVLVKFDIGVISTGLVTFSVTFAASSSASSLAAPTAGSSAAFTLFGVALPRRLRITASGSNSVWHPGHTIGVLLKS